MLVNINNNQYDSWNWGLVLLKNIKIINNKLIIGDTLTFKCKDEIFINTNKSNFILIGKQIGIKKNKKLTVLKKKRRKNFINKICFKPFDTLIQIVKLINIGT